jgi:ribosomal protein S18 acetylase RimI-like enzyme
MNLINSSNSLFDQRDPTNNKGHVQEFIQTSNNDPILAELRRLFVASFYEYYKTIEPQLDLPAGKTLLLWLEQAFDEEVDELFSHRCRCFLALSSSTIVGFLTTQESKNDSNGIYISQCAVDPACKRQGYGLQLLQHLSTIFPSATSYTCLCRRVNKPALDFYEKCGAKLIDDDRIATKYGYNPVNYLGFQFSNTQLHRDYGKPN